MSLSVLPSPFRVRGEVVEAEEPKHSFDCLMLLLSESDSKEITDWTIENVPDFHLGPGGREHRPHVTVAYGFEEGFDPSLLKPLLNRPVQIELGQASLFPGWNNEDGSVLKLDVESPELHTLHEAIKGRFDLPGDSHPDYRPHVTLCYLDPEIAEGYDGVDNPFTGRKMILDRVWWSGADGESEEWRIGSMGGIKSIQSSPFRGRKGLFSGLRSAGRWLADKWSEYETHLGREQALKAALNALAAFFPQLTQGNISEVVKIAEGLRGLYEGNAPKKVKQDGWKPPQYGKALSWLDPGRGGALVPPPAQGKLVSPFRGRKSLKPI